MLPTWGLSKIGFKQKDLSTIKDELEDALRREVDPTLHFSSGSIAGILTGIVANQACQVWESLSGLYNSLQPDAATGRSLDALCSLTGTYRRKASFSKAKAMVKLGKHTSLPRGSRIMTVGGHFFKTTSEVTNNSNDEATKEADFIAESVGPNIAHNDSIATIMTLITGWLSVSIINTYEVGQIDETDDELRIRRIRELRAVGSSTLDSMRSRLGGLYGVEAVYIKEGEHSFEVVIKGGNELEIAQTIWACKPLGVRSTGSITQTVEDSIKQERLVKFSRPTLIHLTLHANIKVKSQFDDNAIKTTLADFARKCFSLGAEVYPSRFFATLLAHTEVLDVITLQLRDRSSGNIAPTEIKKDEIASLSFTDIYIQQIVEAV
jgi:uncharacterized phage protein gp47/JayE